MENLLEAVKALKDKRQENGQPSFESLKAAYTELLQKEKALGAYLDDASVPVEMREAKTDEFKDILRRLNQLLMDIVHAGHHLKSEEVRNGFSE